MRPETAAAFYRLGLFSGEQLVSMAEDLLLDDYNSDTLAALAGELKPKYYEVAPMFEEALSELGIELPSEKNALNTVLKVFLKEIVDSKVSPFEGMMRIDNDIYFKFKEGTHSYAKPDKKTDEDGQQKYLGEELGLQFMYTWYRELQDLKDGSTLFYYTDLPRNEAEQKFNEHLREEAAKVLAKMEENT